MMVLALALSAVLVLVAALHVYWGIGGVWPADDALGCARTVVGFRGVRTMPAPSASFAVALVLVAVALVALALGPVFATPFAPPTLAGAGLWAALVFIARGIAGFTPWWRRLTPEMPFARLDVRYYSPACLLLGAGLLVLSLEGLSA